MKTYVVLPNRQPAPLPPEFDDEPDVRYSPSLVEYLLERFTAEGDTVLDPFAGFGTTLKTAESLGRTAYGVEFDERRVRYARSLLKYPENLLHGDSRRLNWYGLPSFDFSLTSPPYMGPGDAQDPLMGYSVPGQGYGAYLNGIRDIYAQMGRLMKETGLIVIEVSNLKRPGGVTTLAWDMAAKVSEVLRFDGEIVIAWEETYGFGYDHSYCLLFRKRE